MLSSPILLTLAGTGFTFAMTALGACAVFLIGKKKPDLWHSLSMGFAAGVMTAASCWSLLIPSIELSADGPLPEWLPATAGFGLGELFLVALDELMPHMHPTSDTPEGPKAHLPRSSLLFMAVTLHNIPEGMSAGLSFGMAGLSGDPAALASAVALAVGLGIQNVPEGAAVALPLLLDGKSKGYAFTLGALSGLAEPVFGILAAFAVAAVAPAMPWLLAFTAGAMIYVVVEELVPSAHLSEHSDSGTLSFIAGFLVMMALDVALG